GRDSKPVNPAPAAGTSGPVMNPTVQMRQAPPPARNYAPFNGTQPQRLADQAPATQQPVATNPPQAAPVVQAPVPAPVAVAAKPAPVVAPRTAAPVVQPRKEALPPVTVNVAEKLQLERDVPAAAPSPVRAEIIAAPQTPVVTGPKSAPSFTARPTPEEEPIFEEPVMVDADAESPFEAPVEVELGEAAPMPVEGADIVAAEPAKDFPEPFPEEDEEEADEEAMESPFSGLALDEEQPIVAQPFPMEAAPQTEAIAEPAPLAVPVIAAEAAPAPMTPAIEPEEPAKVVAAPVQTAPVGDDEFFPADVPQSTQSKPATEEPALTLPNDPVIATPNKSPEEVAYATKMQKIKDRGGMKGLKGFCPVTLRDERELKDAKPEFHAQFRGQKFHFASAEAKAKFEQSPGNYAPAAYGADVVVLIRDKDVAEGTLDYAAWFKGQLYLFSSEATHAVFSDDPAKFASPVGIE
ncbi:MAG TPA: hypothetical protein VFG20_17625, partial [Planctomycetaceae bacterium]|nr:hypothetical protein [Planctomycetaceae bacterium]